MLEELQQGQKLLVLRYGKQIIENCIELHQEIIEEIGYCWFGKLGTVPSKNPLMLCWKRKILLLFCMLEVLFSYVELVKCLMISRKKATRIITTQKYLKSVHIQRYILN